LALAEHLDVPLRDRNTMLLAAGYAPRFSHAPLDDEAMTSITASLRRLLDAHDPFPGVVLDRSWNIVLANAGAGRLVAGLPPELVAPPVNLFRASLHPDGFAAHTTNFDVWAAYLLRQLRRLIAAADGPELRSLHEEILAYPNIIELQGRERGRRSGDEHELLITCNLDLGGRPLSMFTTLTTFGTPQDVTLDELVIELFFPADPPSEELLRQLAATGSSAGR
jgi:MmyB-like transcription regulator ligand binding domain